MVSLSVTIEAIATPYDLYTYYLLLSNNSIDNNIITKLTTKVLKYIC